MAAVGFAVLVGAGPSVLRAVATGAVVAVGLGLGRRARPLPALAAVVIGLLVVDPWATGALGFQLSVVATAAIVLLATPAAVALGGDRWLARRLLPVLTVPLAAQSAVGPVLVLADPAVSWWAVPANVAVAPAVVPATLAGLVATVLAPVLPGVAVLVGRVAAVPTGWIAVVARTTAALPGASTPWTPGPAGAVGLAALVAAAWLAGRAVLAQARGGGVPRGAS
jgi:competence protein ComEC